MKETNYWDKFLDSGKIEDYLFFKENEMIPDETAGRTEDGSYAGFRDSDRDGFKGGACGRIR